MRLVVASLVLLFGCLHVDSSQEPDGSGAGGKADGPGYRVELITHGAGHDFSAKIDAFGTLHAAFVVDSRVVYARRDRGANSPFVMEDVARGDDLGGTGLALGPTGEVAIVYARGRTIELARHEGGVWSNEAVGDTRVALPHPAPVIAIDGAGRTYIAYVSIFNYTEIHYFVREHGKPVKTGVIDTSGLYTVTPEGAGAPHLALDSAGGAHLCFLQAREGASDLLYAHWNGSDWMPEVAERGGHVGADCGIAVDATGVPHISHMDWQSFDLRHAYRSGGKWHGELLQDSGEAGKFSSAAVGIDGGVEFAYLDVARSALRHAVVCPFGWQLEDVLANGAYGSGGIGFAIDPYGSPRYLTTQINGNTLDVVYLAP